MPKSGGVTAYVFRLQLQQASVFPAVSKAAYSSFLASLNIDGKPIQLSPPTELPLTSDLMSFADRVKRFTTRGKHGTFLLIFEILQERADVREYDDICDGIALALGGSKFNPFCVV